MFSLDLVGSFVSIQYVKNWFYFEEIWRFIKYGLKISWHKTYIMIPDIQLYFAHCLPLLSTGTNFEQRDKKQNIPESSLLDCISPAGNMNFCWIKSSQVLWVLAQTQKDFNQDKIIKTSVLVF